jgi:D-inositol-3-phosphate glycosyltransferase
MHSSPTTVRRVLVIEQGGRGGVADYTAELVVALGNEGVHVELATAHDHLYADLGGVEIWTPFYYFRSGTGLRRAAHRLAIHKVINALAFLVAVPRIVSRARGSDIVHLQGGRFPPLYLVLMVALRVTGAVIVHTPHNTFDRGASLGLARRIMTAVPARIIVHARADIAQMPPRARRRARVVPHGQYAGFAARAAGPRDREQARASLGLPTEAVIALLFGQLRLDKGIEDAVRALQEVPDMHLVLAGEEYGAVAATSALRNGSSVGSHVHVFEGFHPPDRVAVFFAAADVVLLPYHRVSQSGVLQLAYAFERPVVAYPVGGLPEAVINGTTGWLTSRPDVPSLVDAMRDVTEVSEAERRRRGEEARRLAATRFAWDAIARETLTIYAEALA